MIPYFPVTSGSSWTYSDGKTVSVSNFQFINDTLRVTILNSHDSGYVNLEITADEIKTTGYSNPAYIMVAYYMTPLTLLKFPISLGTNWVSNLTSNGYPVTVNAEITQTSISVALNGQTYPNCFELTWAYSYPQGYDWNTWLVTRKMYFDQNIGCIKKIDTWSNGSETSTELVASTIVQPDSLLDTDKDGVPDQWDNCANTPTGSVVYSNGCPAIKGDFNDNGKLDLGDVIGVLQILTGGSGAEM